MTGGSPARPRASVGDWLRILHPFPSALDALTVAVLAWLAGGVPILVVTLASAMLALQFSIGIVNDIADAGADARAGRAGKPIGAGRIRPGAASRLAALLATLGLALAAATGPLPALVATAGLAVGILYDVRLKRTMWSFLPFAVGIPLLPIFAWTGVAGEIPGRVVLLALMAIPAGAGLAMANAVADLGVDAEAGVRTVAGSVGPRTGLVITGLLEGSVLAVALVTTASASPAILVGVAITASGLVAATRWPRVGWEVQALGLAATAAGWIAASVAAGSMA